MNCERSEPKFYTLIFFCTHPLFFFTHPFFFFTHTVSQILPKPLLEPASLQGLAFVTDLAHIIALSLRGFMALSLTVFKMSA